MYGYQALIPKTFKASQIEWDIGHITLYPDDLGDPVINLKQKKVTDVWYETSLTTTGLETYRLETTTFGTQSELDPRQLKIDGIETWDSTTKKFRPEVIPSSTP